MTDLPAIALECAGRGWHVFPCAPRSKRPATPNGYKDATNDEAAIRAWWERTPDANVAIATGASGLCVLDCDTGFADEMEFLAWHIRNNLPMSYAVRTGRRGSYGVQLYFTGSGIKSIAWEQDGVAGDIRCATGYVMAEGSVHPDSGEVYEHIWPGLACVLPVPSFVSRLRAAPKTGALGNQNAPVTDDGGKISSNRNVHMISLLGKKRSEGADDEALHDYALEVNENRMDPPLDEEELERLITNACKFAIPEAEPIPVLSGKVAGLLAPPPPEPPARPWQEIFHTKEETENTPDPEFLISGFLQIESVTGLIGPARARKSIVTLNIIHALLTGTKLFGKFDVLNRPARVVYLCPESGKKSLARRIRNMGMVPFVGDSLFFTSMNSDPIRLENPRLREAMQGSVVFIDTAIRFFDGNENESKDMKVLGDTCQSIIRGGALAIVLLHHTSKNTER